MTLFVRALWGVVALLALGAVAAGVVGDTWLAPMLPGIPVNAAMCLLALVAAQVRPRRQLVNLATALVAVVALATIFQFAAGISLGIDEMLVDDQFPSGPYPGRMSVGTAACLLLLALATVTLRAGHRSIGEALALTTMPLTALALLANLYGVTDLVAPGDYFAMRSSTAVALLLLMVAMLVEVPRGLARWIMSGSDAGAIIQRRLLPFIIVLLPALAALRLVVADADWYNDRFGIAVNVTVGTAFLAAISLRVGIALRSVDHQRVRALDELMKLNAELEHRVRVRSEALQHERTQVAVLRDRNRIARDLHDRVIQRVFAAGLRLVEIGGATPVTGEGIDDVVDQLNTCIRELRETIFKLELAAEQDMSRALSMMTARLEAILGFAPDVTVEGDSARLGSQLADHLLAVAHEALMNIAKHAAASHAEIWLCINDRSAILAVADDGRGVPQSLSGGNGLGNIRSRAAELRGTVMWEARESGGMQLTFQAPLESPQAELPEPTDTVPEATHSERRRTSPLVGG